MVHSPVFVVSQCVNIYYNLFTHSTADRHVGSWHFRLLQKVLLWTLHMYFCKNMDAFLLCIFLGMEFLGHMSRFRRCCHTGFQCDWSIYTPTSSVWEFRLLYVLTNIFSTSIIFKHGFKQKFLIQLTFLESLLCVRCSSKWWDMRVLTLKQYIMLPPLLTHLTKIATSVLTSFYSRRDADRQSHSTAAWPSLL